jgi:prepilin-type N-terminal cleavage/methylation domain-containing protein
MKSGFDKTKKGFSLIELLISLSIFCIITYILLFSFKSFKTSVKRKEIKAQKKIACFVEQIANEIHNIYLNKNFHVIGNNSQLTFMTLASPENRLKKIEYFIEDNTLQKKEQLFLNISPPIRKQIFKIKEMNFSYFIDGVWLETCNKKNTPQAIKLKATISITKQKTLLNFSTILKIN